LVLEKIRNRFPWLQLVWADAGYHAHQVDTAVAKIPVLRLEIVKRSDDVKGFVVLPRRWVVERTFSWLGRNRRLAKDFENLADTLATFVPSLPSNSPSGGSPGGRCWQRRTAVIGSLEGVLPAPTGMSKMRRKRPSVRAPYGGPQRPGGGVKPPNSRSTRPANAIVVRSSRKPPIICMPIGRPRLSCPIGIVVDGNPFNVAMPAHA